MPHARFSSEEIVRRGEELYAQQICSIIIAIYKQWDHNR